MALRFFFVRGRGMFRNRKHRAKLGITNRSRSVLQRIVQGSSPESG